MRFHRKAQGSPGRLGILAGAFHPPTLAHLALAEAALSSAETDEVLFVLPGILPHKRYDGVPLERRLHLLEEILRAEHRFSVAVSAGGLFLDIAREARQHYPEARLRFLCGRDAAERIVGWNYGPLPPIEDQLKEYELLVAPRQGLYAPPAPLTPSIGHLPIDAVYDEVSSTEVRQRIEQGVKWEHLVPDSIIEQVRRLYIR